MALQAWSVWAPMRCSMPTGLPREYFSFSFSSVLFFSVSSFGCALLCHLATVFRLTHRPHRLSPVLLRMAATQQNAITRFSSPPYRTRGHRGFASVMSCDYFSFSFSFVRFGGLIWLYSSSEEVAVSDTLNQRADVP